MNNTIQEIVEFIIGSEQPVTPHKKPLDVFNSRTYDILRCQTTRTIIDTITGYLEGNIPASDIKRRIKPSNIFKYLAACKVLDECARCSFKTTWYIRSLCLKKSQGKITLMNILFNPPLDYISKEEYINEEDIMILNETDNNHEVIHRAPFGEERDKILKDLYIFCQTKALLISEFADEIMGIVSTRFQALLYLGDGLPPQTAIIYRGCSGSGKTKMLKDTYSDMSIIYKNRPLIDTGIQSTDNFKKDIKAAFTSKFPDLQVTDSQAHLLAFSVFKVFCNVLRKSMYKSVPTISEGWYNSKSSIDELCAMRDEYGLKLQINDFDGDALTIFLRALLRRDESGAPTPPLSAVVRSFKMCRENRPYLVSKLKEDDSYRLFYSTGNRIDEIPYNSILVSSFNIDTLLKDVCSHVITEDDIQTYGKGLEKYIGMSISEAYK